MSQQTEEELGVDRINSLKDFSIDLDLETITDPDELALNLVGSWQEKSGELLKKRGKVLLCTLLWTIQPISLEDLANKLGYRSKDRYRDDYIKPLKDNKLIEYTLEQANDPKQQYKIMERGIHFLIGHPL